METFLILDRNLAAMLKSLHKFPYRQGVGDRFLFVVSAKDAERFRWAIVKLEIECWQLG